MFSNAVISPKSNWATCALGDSLANLHLFVISSRSRKDAILRLFVISGRSRKDANLRLFVTSWRSRKDAILRLSTFLFSPSPRNNEITKWHKSATIHKCQTSWNRKGLCNKPTKWQFQSILTRTILMLSKRYESTDVDRRTWLHVPSGTQWPTSSDTHQVVQI